eukprot:6185648-Pleurochrysis_carterae.AAC.3
MAIKGLELSVDLSSNLRHRALTCACPLDPQPILTRPVRLHVCVRVILYALRVAASAKASRSAPSIRTTRQASRRGA